MEETLVSQIIDAVSSKGRVIPCGPANDKEIVYAETALEFSIPPLLKAALSKIGNGGYGPGKGGSIIGVNGGYESDFGTLVETYYKLKRDQESEGRQWKVGLLPFCEWGCNIFSCVDCTNSSYPMFLFEDFEALPTGYSLDEFFTLWIDGADLLSHRGSNPGTAEIINPFTGHKTHVMKSRKK